MTASSRFALALVLLSACREKPAQPDAPRPQKIVSTTFTNDQGQEVKVDFDQGKMSVDGKKMNPCGEGKLVVGANGAERWCTGVDGVRHGLYKSSHKNGMYSVAGQYRSGKRHGDWRYWTPGASLYAVETYEDGRLVRAETHAGSVIEAVAAAKPFLQAWWLSGDAACAPGTLFAGAAPPAGALTYCQRSDGTKDGPFCRWDKEDGKIKITEGAYKDGRADGPYVVWSDSGIKLEQGTMSLGKFQGVYRTFYNDGNKQTIGQFKDGQRKGRWITYSPTGKVKSSEKY